MTDTAFIFPGQGAQKVGMAVDLVAEFDVAREVFDRASAASRLDLLRLCKYGPAEQLTLTEHAQPAILTASIAAWEVLRSHLDPKIRAVALAGHSLGEYSALVASGAMSLEHAVRVVHARGQAMQRAVPAGVGKMAALMGLDPDKVLEICKEASGDEVVEPANFNAPAQIVIAGHAAAVERACEKAKEAGAKAIPLEVSAPFHCSLMRPAAEMLAPVLERTPIATAEIPVIRNVDAKAHGGPDYIREALLQQVTSPVRWVQCVESLQAAGAARFVEVGPGRVLSGLLKRIDRSLDVSNVEDVDSFRKTAEKLAA